MGCDFNRLHFKAVQLHAIFQRKNSVVTRQESDNLKIKFNFTPNWIEMKAGLTKRLISTRIKTLELNLLDLNII